MHRLGLRFGKHRRPLEGLRCEADALFPRERVAVFVDGKFWHRHPSAPPVAGNAEFWAAKFKRNVERDRRQAEALSLASWRVVRVWEAEASVMAAEVVQAMKLGPPDVASLTTLFRRSELATSGCWLWRGSMIGVGYARWPNERLSTRYAHRIAYMLFRGPLPGPSERNRVELDHLCKERACVNPWHLELVTRRENVLRGSSVTAEHARQETCVNGHPLTEENTYNRPDRELGRGRMCRACRRERNRARRLSPARRRA